MFYDLLLQLVLLLSAMSEQPLEQFATTEAIQCTEIYEFEQRLASKEYELPHLQVRDIISTKPNRRLKAAGEL